MSLVTPEDERRIYEKYGTFLRDSKEFNYLTGDKLLAKLPKTAHVSKWIFSRGFFYNRRGIVYRPGIVRIWEIPYIAGVGWLDVSAKALCLCLIGFFPIGSVLNLLGWTMSFFVFLPQLVMTALRMKFPSPVELDLNKKMIYFGYIKPLSVPMTFFEEVRSIAGGPWYARSRGAQVVLRYRDKDMAFKEMPFVYLLPHEKRLAEVICKSLAALWPEPISITLWGNQDMDPGSSMISRDRNFGLEPNVAGKEMVEKSEEAVDNDLSRSNGEKEGERGYRYRTREEWMEKLPPGTPISTSIFTRGFYYRDDVMRYRPSFWQEFRSSAARGFPLGDLFFKGMTLFLIFQPNIRWHLCGLILCFWTFLLQLCVSVMRITPALELDLNQKVLRTGNLFVSEIPMTEIKQIRVQMYRDPLGEIIHQKLGAIIFLPYYKGKYKSLAAIEIAYLLPQEEQWIEGVVNALIALWPYKLEVKYILEWKEMK